MTICLACKQAVMFGFCLTALFSGESCLHDTIASSLWKKLLIKDSCIYSVIPPKGRDFWTVFGLKSGIGACGMGIGQVHYNVRDIYI